MPLLATIEALEARLGRTLTGAARAQAEAAIADASALVREEARRSFLDEDGNIVAPPAVITVVLQAALRAVRNPEGYTGETLGQYSYRRSDEDLSVYLTDAEREIVGRYRQSSRALWTLPTTRGDCSRYADTIWVDDQYGTEPFPMYAKDDVRHTSP